MDNLLSKWQDNDYQLWECNIIHDISYWLLSTQIEWASLSIPNEKP